MKSLAVCPTYGRIPFLSRMLSGFLHQTYDDKHLVIINDDKNIQLCCAANNVTVLNTNCRMLVSEKRNLGTSFGHYDIIFPWDDDDVYLPKRIQNHVSKYNNPEVRAYRNMSMFMVYGDEFTTSESGCINSKSFLKDEWFARKGYQERTWVGEDTELYNKLQGLKLENNENERDFVYMFGGVNYHISSKPNIEILEEMAYTQLEELNLVGKKYWIEPDFEQYSNFLLLEKLYNENQKTLKMKHVSLGKIDITHLL